MAAAWRRLRERAQFQALLGTRPTARSAHFALHRWLPDAASAAPAALDAASVAARADAPPAAASAPAAAALFAPSDVVWIGAMTPKRWARRAVTRNLMRRQIYAVFSPAALRLPAGAHLIRLRAGFDVARFPSAASPALRRAVRGELQSLLERATA